MEEEKVIVKLKKQPLKSEREEIRLKKRHNFLLVLACVFLFISGIVVGICIFSLNNKSEDIAAYNKFEEIKEYMNRVWLYKNDYEDLSSVLDDKAYKGMLSFDDDAYTTYMSSTELETYSSSINMNYVGIGVQYNSYNFTITRVYKDSSAYNSGIEVGDVICKVDGKEVNGKSTTELREMVTGKEGTTVDITLSRKGEEFTVTVVRSGMDNTVYASAYDNYVVLEIMSFGNNTGNECIKYLDDYRDYENIIIDLRNNGGGYEKSVQEVAGIFLGKDKIVMHKVYVNNDVDTDYTISNAYYDNFKNIVILTNGGTASAAEVLTLALKEQHDNVTIVGTTTYGKGVMQTSYLLKDGSAVKVTMAYWTSPNNVSINGVGIEPDEEIKLADLFYEVAYGYPMEDVSYTYDEVSEYIKITQLSLDYLGYKVDRKDGYFDDSTLRALNTYKADNNLEVDGILDSSTYSILYSSVVYAYRYDESKDLQMIRAKEIINEQG